MSGSRSIRPKLPSHYLLRFEPPDRFGDEVLVITSERRRIKLKGHSFREFMNEVVPLLDGSRTTEEIQQLVRGTFAPEDVAAALDMLASEGLLEDQGRDAPPAPDLPLDHQLNFFHEANLDPERAQDRLRTATVSIIGMGPVGAATALALAAAGVGHLRCADADAVLRSDPMLNPQFQTGDVGKMRAEVVCGKATALVPGVTATPCTAPLDTDDEVLRVITGSDFAVGCVDQSMSNLLYRLNRVCLRAGIRSTTGSVSAFEGILGPTVTPYETSCYLCYRMRAVACAENPEEEFAQARLLDRRKRDDSGRRENLVFGPAIVGNMLALEAFRVLLGLPATASGRIVAFDFLEATSQKHVVLRKPWCPACFVRDAEAPPR
jgi:bacteriocin biosynthesis cyclodehydratase domain-containing protein